MLYVSTRGGSAPITAGEAILKGIGPDGGLYVPEKLPKMDKSLEELSKLDYKGLCYEVLKLYLTDYDEDELKSCINKAYDEKFDDPLIAPLIEVKGKYFLELFHGRTLAFKDMALSILPYLLKSAAKAKGLDKEIVILTATSGDTGKAALEGFANVEGVRIIVFYPENGVSSIQKLQMVTQEGSNTAVIGVKGNFDQAQTGVKKIFTDPEIGSELSQKGIMFSSANSINIGRLLPQIVYYYSAYLQMVTRKYISLGESLNFVVPTGNFGNILACYYAKSMGLPIGTLVCASNDNKVLYDFFATGEYNKNREFYTTISPSMDILISSNLERLIYHSAGVERTKELMACLNKNGVYSFTESIPGFKGYYATEAEAKGSIEEMFEEGYLMDPHTAVAYDAGQKFNMEGQASGKNIILSTASPYKFTESVCSALNMETETNDPFVLMELLEEYSGVPAPKALSELKGKKVRHKMVCGLEDMDKALRQIIM